MTASKLTRDITDASFDHDVLRGPRPSIVDFWAEWCGPCRALAPTLDAIARDYEGKADVFKLNADENQLIAARYGIRGLPTLLLFKDGQLVDQLVGYQSREALTAAVERLLARG